MPPQMVFFLLLGKMDIIAAGKLQVASKVVYMILKIPQLFVASACLSNNMDFPLPKRRKTNTDSINTTQEEASPSSSSPLTRSSPYDVFLSFRGVDTRNNFTGHLYTYLVQKGINTFMDDEELRKGEEISSSLLKAIQGSKISILIFSENYASSGWCLDELVEILKCKKLNQQLVWPVFYKVDPSDVRYQKGKYGEALAKHECRFKENMDKVQRWRTALREAADFSGWTFFDGHEANFISTIAEEISAQVSKRSCLNVAKYPVGIESRVQDLLRLLDVGGSDVRMVGIWGIGGIGKTTIANELFNSFRHKFEGWCFLANVRKDSVSHQGLVGLQNNLLNEILGGRKMEMTNADRGIQVIKDRLRSKRVLIVLDDVNELNQLDKLAGGLDWFGRGSRIIITTRDKGLLISHQVNAIYTAKALDDDEARNLLILNALKGNKNPDEFVKFPIDDAVRFAHGLPLAINILGSLLSGRSINQWYDTIDCFTRSPDRDIQTVLQTSYDVLQYPLKEAFLDIACFFKGKDKEYVMQALEGSNTLTPVHALEVLEEKALIKIEKSGRISMHDLLEEMGKEIVLRESPTDAGSRSRIWFHEDVYHVLTENTGSKEVKGIRVELPREYEIRLTAKSFKKMKNLQLFININACFSGEVNYLPNKLRFLDWPGFPAQSLPSEFNPQKLVNLNMPNSRISRVGQGLKNLQNLKSLSFRSCEFLIELPNLSGMFPNLERLDLNSCTSLAELHPSVGSLDKLVHFDLTDCYSLKMFPNIGNMKSLQYLDLGGCRRLESFPQMNGRMESLTHMNVSGTAITEVPSSIGYHLFNLQFLILQKCENLSNLPLSIFDLQKLFYLELTGCPKLVLPFPNKVKYGEVPTPTSNSKNSSLYSKETSSERESDDADVKDQGNSVFPSLEYLNAGGCNISNCDFLVTLGYASNIEALNFSESNFVNLPACISTFTNLSHLILNGCKRLQEVPELPPNLQVLEVRGCKSLERISKLSNILKHEESQMFWWLDLTNCWRLCHNLVQYAEKKGWLVNDDDHQVGDDLLSLFLCSQKSAFGVVFPASYEIPKFFSCQMDFTGNGLFEFYIQVLPNFQWHNTGLALCVAGEEVLDWEFEIRINEARVLTDHCLNEGDSPLLGLQYIPFDTIRFDSLPPFICRVSIFQSLYTNVVPMKRCGVHLVMPPNEECMKLTHAQNIRNRLKAVDDSYELKSSDSHTKLAKSLREDGPSGLKSLIDY
uniref:TMV resistance protein N-like isoform X2 n=1 Tax=Fragaria vesca subsp. vesca TaxID=101020 RepID=UPI0005CB5DDC|nr:PREDICTED: TMV resistance protein N-like isoform X2 [Fragaria vesca subsp. vesca]